MQNNFLEELVAEWLEYKGYIVKRNERVGRRKEGGYEGELDVVAFNPKTNHLIHFETSTDTGSWDYREERFRNKFTTGDKYIRALFDGLAVPNEIEKKALLYASNKYHKTIGGGQVVAVKEYFRMILGELRGISYQSQAIPEKYPVLRALREAAEYWGKDLEAPW